ncbi:MAG: hypothetical protein HY785_02255 [Oscillatoriophycideae cyanobacterium NC_groundwater_1537_Pr4_S-0.65um_50_18]|nr:hypothetical protein [Oscillatoriophycideae cyanobacterium NC_groundwater_1537_Pr4_S-0.65um_50_18]
MSKIQEIQISLQQPALKTRFKARLKLKKAVGLSMLTFWGIAAAIAPPPAQAESWQERAMAQASGEALGETLLTFETPQYAVRLFRQRGILRLNLYNRQTDRVEQRGMPMQQTVIDTGIIYTNLQGEADYTIAVAPDGSSYELKIQQGDRITYSQRIQNQQAKPAPTESQPVAPPAEPPSSPPVQQSATALQPSLDNATIARFQTPKYVVRIYSQDDQVRMNLYNRRTDQVELKAVAVKSTSSPSSTTYAYLSGNFIYTATVMPIGGYRLVVTQGDRIIYNEQGY